TKISVSVDKNTNSLVVMAQPQDIALIHELVAQLDVAGGDVEEQIEVVSLTGTNLNVDMIDTALKGVLGAKARTNNSSSSSGSNSSSSPQSSSDNNRSSSDSDQARRTAEFYQQLRERFQGGSSSGRSFGGPPGGFGGFGGFRGAPSGGSSSGRGR
ncbi:MAG: secretin N-terminal domain-containing protein, partial [Aureliella sp.]